MPTLCCRHSAPYPSHRLRPQANLQLVAGLSHAFADLEAPSRAVALARDPGLLRFYSDALHHALALRGARPACMRADCGRHSRRPLPGCDGDDSDGSSESDEDGPNGGGGQCLGAGMTGDAHVLVLGAGAGGVLALLAAAAGARRVTVIERSPLALRAAQRLVGANAGALEAMGCSVELALAPLERCMLRERAPWAAPAPGSQARAAADEQAGYDAGPLSKGGLQGGLQQDEGQEQQGLNGGAAAPRVAQHAASRGAAATYWLEGPPADVVVTDLVAHPRCAGAWHGMVQVAAPRAERNGYTSTAARASTSPPNPAPGPLDPSLSLLGLGLLPALAAAVDRRLVAAGARVVPERAAVLGAPAECRVPPAAGFDLEPALRRFKWHPGLAPVDAAR